MSFGPLLGLWVGSKKPILPRLWSHSWIRGRDPNHCSSPMSPASFFGIRKPVVVPVGWWHEEDFGIGVVNWYPIHIERRWRLKCILPGYQFWYLRLSRNGLVRNPGEVDCGPVRLNFGILDRVPPFPTSNLFFAGKASIRRVGSMPIFLRFDNESLQHSHPFSGLPREFEILYTFLRV